MVIFITLKLNLKNNLKLSVVIPCYNESKNLPFLLKKIDELLLQNFIEVILVDNGSSDNTFSIIKEYENKMLNVKCLRIENNIGYGDGILKGLKIAEGEILSWTHADIQTDPKDLIKGLKFFDSKNKNIFVKGLRYGRPFDERLFTISMSFFCSFILRKFLWDINAQPTMFSASLLSNWENPPNDFSLDLFAYFEAIKRGYKIHRFPVNFGSRLYGKSSWNINLLSKLRFIIRSIKFTLKLAKKNI